MVEKTFTWKPVEAGATDRLVFSPASFQKQIEPTYTGVGAYIGLGAQAALQTKKRKQLAVRVEMLVHISWQFLLKVQFRDINGAIAVVKIISTQEF